MVKPTIIIKAKQTTAINWFGAITPGSGYTNGVYNNTALTGGSGTGATANITISGGGITLIQVVKGGEGYTGSDTLSASLPGGSGFYVSIQELGNYIETDIKPSFNSNLAGDSVASFVIDDPDPNDPTILADNLRIIIKQ